MTKPVRLARKTVYESPWVNLYLDDVRFPNGRLIENYHLLDFPREAVTMLVENEQGSVILARICRYTTGLTEWELPAGGMEPGETVFDAARREVLEETGYAAEGFRLVYSFYPMNGSANKLFHVVHCKATTWVQSFDPDEVSDTRWFTRAEIRQMIAERSLSDGFALTALLLWLQGW